MAETFFAEMKRYVRFGADDETALRAVHPHAAPHFRRISEEFYARLEQHDDARNVFTGPDQVERLKGTLVVWMDLLFTGPWDEAYFDRRARIGRMHVKINLPQRYMFAAMDLIRLSLQNIVQDAYPADNDARAAAVRAIAKIIDLELAIMLETYREAFVERVQKLERLEKNVLERRLAISEARYEEIVETSAALIMTADSNGRIHLWNRRCEEATGVPRSEALGTTWMELLADERDRNQLADRVIDLMQGTRVPPYEGPVPNRAGGEERRVRWHFTSLPGAIEPLVCGIGVDVTEEHALGLRSRRAERLAALGTMAAGLAHEIRNPLNAAHLQLTLLQRRLAKASGAEIEAARDSAALAASEMKRLAGLVDEFLQFARPQALRLTRGDLRATAEVITQLVGPTAEDAGVEVRLLPGEKVTTSYDDERIKQVLHNLVRNAVEAVGRGGHVLLDVRETGDSAVVSVADDGPGLPAPDAPIFEPFFTTKESGTGLGLAIVHRIVTDHGGRITVESRPGRTVFEVALPLE